MGSRRGVIVAVAALVGGLLALIVYSSMGLAQVTGEICFTFNGRTECREASGTTREEAIRTAAEMACSAMAAGMTQRINCTQSPPTRVSWSE